MTYSHHTNILCRYHYDSVIGLIKIDLKTGQPELECVNIEQYTITTV